MKGIVTRTKQAKALLKAVSVTRRDYLCLGLIIALWTINNALWAGRDTTPPTFYDDSRYLYVSLKQLAVLRGPWQQAGELMDISHRGRPPLYTLVTQPVYWLVGTSEDAAIVATNAIFIVILVVSVYGIGKRLFDSRTGLLAAILLAGYPTLTILSRRYLPHFAAPAMIALGAYLLLRTEDFRITRYSIMFGLVTGLGMLISVYVAFGLVGLALWFVCRSLHLVYRTRDAEPHREAPLRILGNVVLALCIALAFSLPWYARHAQGMFNILQRVQATKIHAPVEDLFKISLQAFLWYLLNIHRALSVVFVPGFLLGILVALIRPRHSSVTLLLWFGSTCLLLSLLATATPGYWHLLHFFGIVLPAVALVSAFWVFELRKKALRLLLVGLLVLLSGCVFVEAAWGLPFAPKQLLALGVRAVLPLREEWHIEDLLALVDQDSQGEDKKLLIVSDMAEFHEGQFGPQALRMGSAASIRHCRWAQPDESLNADYIAVGLRREGEQIAPKWQGTPCDMWSDLLRTPPQPFVASHSLLGAFRLPGESEARIYKLTRPVSFDDAMALMDAIERLRPRDEDPAFHQTLGWLYSEQGLLDAAIVEYEKVIELVPTSASAYWGLGAAYQRLGWTEQAVTAYREVLRINPASDEAQARIEQLSPALQVCSLRPLWRNLGDLLAFPGYDLFPTSLRAGGTLQLTLCWQALAKMDRDYTAFIHLLDTHDRIWAQGDRILQHGERPTSTWVVGETVTAQHDLQTSPDTPPGEYVVKVGVYYWETGERLLVWDEDGERVAADAILLETITVTE